MINGKIRLNIVRSSVRPATGTARKQGRPGAFLLRRESVCLDCQPTKTYCAGLRFYRWELSGAIPQTVYFEVARAGIGSLLSTSVNHARRMPDGRGMGWYS